MTQMHETCFSLRSVYEGRSCSLVRIRSESCPWSSHAWQPRMKGKINELRNNISPEKKITCN